MKYVWRALKFAGLFVGALVAVALVVGGFVNWRSDVRFEQQLSQLRAEGQPVRISDLAGKPIAPEDNAVTYLRRAKDDLEAIQKEVGAAEDAAPQADQEAMDEGRLTPALVGPVRAALEAYPAGVALVLRAADCRDYASPLDFTTDARTFQEALLSQVGLSRAAVRVLNYRAMLLAAEGKPDESLATSIAMLRLTRHFDREPTMVSHMVALAYRGVYLPSVNRVLRTGAVSAAAHDALEEELKRHDLVEAAREALRTERAFGLTLIHDMFADKRIGWLPWVKKYRSDYVDDIGQVIEVASSPPWPSAPREKFTTAVERSGTRVQLLAPGLQAMQDAVCRAQAQLRCLRILNVLTRSNLPADAAEPKLTDLGLPADVLVDPYNGEPLRLKKLPEGWLIYSVGKNLKDDGGKVAEIDEYKDVGLGPPVDHDEPERQEED